MFLTKDFSVEGIEQTTYSEKRYLRTDLEVAFAQI
jgi:hypothetical protein